jgi:hypothetical protein
LSVKNVASIIEAMIMRVRKSNWRDKNLLVAAIAEACSAPS